MKKKPVDYPILFTTILLVAIGIVMVFSASYYYTMDRWGDSFYFFKRQCAWALVSLVIMFTMIRIDYWKLKKFANIFVILSLALLIAVLFVGVERNAATRWLNIGGISLQPSEIAKFSIIVFLASSMSKSKEKLKYFFKGVVPYLAFMGVFFGLILLQPNLSTAGSLVILTFIMLFIGGAKMWHLGGLIGVGAVGAAFLVLSEEYRLKRFLAFTDPWADPLDTGWQVIQSLYSLGSGGLFGMGLGMSRQKFLYIPYPETDFIFAIIGEELGFLGAVLIILLFLTLIWRGIKVAITAPDMFGCLLASGIIGLIAIQVIINVAVVSASMPPTGLPLPFISYGGSSLALFMASIGVLLNISKHTQTG